MEATKLRIQKSKLEGQITVSGAKNNALKLLTASVLTSGDVELFNCPNGLLDMQVHIGMLNMMGKTCTEKGSYLKITENKIVPELNWDERSIRNSLLILGCLTTRFGEGKVPLPGGCKLGDRKYDLHIMVLEKLGAQVWEEEGFICTKTTGRLKGCEIFLPIRSTGATENAIFCASLATGTTTIWNPHVRPEIIDLIKMLNKMGAKIKVYGQKCIVVEGVEGLQGVMHRAIPDNMEALTWAIGATITGGDVEIMDFPFEHLEVPLIVLRESGMKFYKGENSLIVRGGTPFPVEISTGPYPGINSDMQPLFGIYGACSRGESNIVDLRFPGRYAYAEEFAKMGVEYSIDGDLLKITGGNKLTGTEVNASDLRAGMALLLAGMVAEGETVIHNAWQIHRGYEDLEKKLALLNVEIH